MAVAIAIDIGGTKIATGLVDSSGMIIGKMVLETDLGISPPQMMERVVTAIRSLLNQYAIDHSRITGIGVGAPGPLDPAAGKLTRPPNLPAWHEFSVIDHLKMNFPFPIRMENDATAAALAEKWIGAAQDSNHFVYITISTGIGAGLFLHGKLLTGSSGNAGDAGHMIVDPAAGICKCGQAGCWEWIASGTSIARQASAILGRHVNAKEAFQLSNHGHQELQQLMSRIYRYIGMGCVSLINILDPDTVVIGGGVSQIGQPLFDSVRTHVSAHALNPSGRETAIVPARLQQDAGLIGAAALILCHY